MSLEAMREMLRRNLGRSLSAMPEVDRLTAAWPVVCGTAMAGHGEVVSWQDGVVLVEVSDGDWMRQMMSMQGQIAGELGRIAGVRVTGVHFERKKNHRG